MNNYQAKQNFLKEAPQKTNSQPRKSFNFGANIQAELKKRAAAMGGIPQQQMVSAPIASSSPNVDPALQGKNKETIFQTPSAKNFHWSSTDQELVDQIANSLGLAVDYLYANDLPYAQKYIIQANQLAGQLEQENDKQACAAIFNSCQGVMAQINPQGAHTVNSEDLQGKIKDAQAQQQAISPPETETKEDSKNELVPVEIPEQKPGWKNTLAVLPFVGALTNVMPDQESMYDSALNLALGDNWQDWKRTINWSLMGTGALASYYLLYKPIFGKKKPVVEKTPEPPKKKARKRRRKTIKRKPKVEEGEDE